MKVRFFSFEALPSKDSVDYQKYGGGQIVCWIKELDESKARVIAEKSILENNWIILALEDSRIVDESSYEEQPETLEFYKQCLIDGEVYEIHTWPNEIQDNDIVH